MKATATAWGSAALLLAGLYAGARSIGPLPALGPFLDPAGGIWSSLRSATLPEEVTHDVPGLDGEVRIVCDDWRVPHIFAESIEDAMRGLGYAVARDRLSQLELQTRAAASTLTELVGEVTLDVDRRSRPLALAWAAARGFRSHSLTPRVREKLLPDFSPRPAQRRSVPQYGIPELRSSTCR